MRSEVLNNIWDHGKSWGVTEKQVISGRSKIMHPDEFGRLDLQVSVDRIVQDLNRKLVSCFISRRFITFPISFLGLLECLFSLFNYIFCPFKSFSH